MRRVSRISTALLAIIIMVAMSAAAFGETLPEGNPTDQVTSAEQPSEEPATQPTEQPATETGEQPATQPVTQPATNTTTAAPKGISADAALSIALRDAGLSKAGARILELDMDEGRSIEIEFIKSSNKAKYEYEIAVSNGRILEKSVEFKYKKTKSKKKIGKKKARKLVAKAAGINYNTVKKGTCRYKYKKKLGKYEVKVRSGSYKYEYELLAKNGKIVEYEYEYIGIR